EVVAPGRWRGEELRRRTGAGAGVAVRQVPDAKAQVVLDGRILVVQHRGHLGAGAHVHLRLVEGDVVRRPADRGRGGGGGAEGGGRREGAAQLWGGRELALMLAPARQWRVLRWTATPAPSGRPLP